MRGHPLLAETVAKYIPHGDKHRIEGIAADPVSLMLKPCGRDLDLGT